MRGGRRQHRRPMSASLCSPFPASPYAFAPGSKIFTFPPPDLSPSGPRRPPLFAPRPRYPLCLRSGEQNLHISAAGFELLGPPAAAPLCSPLPAIPCAFVSGSKIFTFPPPDLSFSGARRPLLFAPPSPLSLMPSFRGAKSSHFRRRI